MNCARPTNPLQCPLEILDANGNAPPIRLQLGFTRSAASSDTSTHSRHFDDMASQARQPIGEPPKLDFQAPVASACTPRNDLQNELGPVEHLDAQLTLLLSLSR